MSFDNQSIYQCTRFNRTTHFPSPSTVVILHLFREYSGHRHCETSQTTFRTAAATGVASMVSAISLSFILRVLCGVCSHRIYSKRRLFPCQRVGPDCSHNTTATASLRAHPLGAPEPWLRVQPLLKRDEWTGSLNNNRDSIESEGYLVHVVAHDCSIERGSGYI